MGPGGRIGPCAADGEGALTDLDGIYRGNAVRARALLLALLVLPGLASLAEAYTAAGDRTFPATIVIPQIAPTDELYLTFTSLDPTSGSRLSTFGTVYNKTITDRFSVGVEDNYDWLSPKKGHVTTGFENFETLAKYLAVLDQENEFLLSLGIDREWGGTGRPGTGAAPIGATTTAMTFGKGMNGVGPDLFHPVSLSGVVGYQFSDGGRRPDRWVTGLSLDYSIPYLEAKVRSVDLPDFFRAMTPMVEVLFSTPIGQSFGARTAITVAPGFNYSGQGWELGLEALLPATQATGNGIGVAAQLHFALDYLFAGRLPGNPLFSPEE